MKKSLLAILMVFVLVFTMAVPVAGASGIRNKIRDLKEKVESAVGGEDKVSVTNTAEGLVKKLLAYVEAKCAEKGIDPAEAIALVTALITDEEGNIDLSAVLSLIGMLTGEGASGDTTYMTEMDNRNTAMEAYITAKYQDMIGPEDVPMITRSFVNNQDLDPRYALCYFSMTVYTPEGKDLKKKDFAESLEYMEFDEDENLNFTVARTVAAEEGENRDASIDSLCEMIGIDRERFNTTFSPDEIEWSLTMEMIDLLDEHPEYERIEYNGEMKTAEEMEKINENLLDVTFDALFAETEVTEEATEEVTE